MTSAMNYVKTTHQELESVYEYTGKDGTCMSKEHTRGVIVKTVNAVTPRSAAQLKAAIAIGPTSVTVCAENSIFGQYKSGIINSSACGTNLNHGITAVGYGTDASAGDYYILRNSWGALWGDNGYVNIAAVEGTDGICGIQKDSVWPTTS